MPLFGFRRRRDYLLAVGEEFALASPVFEPEGPIPARYTCDGEDVSPPLVWEGAPPGTAGYALIVYDPDAPLGTFVHWVLYDIPGSRNGLPEAVPPEPVVPGIGVQGVNDFRRIGYGGPCPPPGHGPHRYVFALHALDVDTLGLPPGATAADVLEAMRGHVLGYAVLVGLYER